jgi:Ca2+-binding EF-hand superfamily protein
MSTIEEVLEEVDEDGDGCINYSEFCNLMRSDSHRLTGCTGYKI